MAKLNTRMKVVNTITLFVCIQQEMGHANCHLYTLKWTVGSPC
jgi:hypothetical protein